MEQVKEMKNICVDGVALFGIVMESLGEKFDQMHHNLKRKIDDIDLSVGNLDSDVDDINTMMERVEERIEEMAVELGAMHQSLMVLLIR
jgi:methyl-accepting chemotaxis protein